MKAGNGQHFEQSYNAQAAVEIESRLIVGEPSERRAQRQRATRADARSGDSGGGAGGASAHRQRLRERASGMRGRAGRKWRANGHDSARGQPLCVSSLSSTTSS